MTDKSVIRWHLNNIQNDLINYLTVFQKFLDVNLMGKLSNFLNNLNNIFMVNNMGETNSLRTVFCACSLKAKYKMKNRKEN